MTVEKYVGRSIFGWIFKCALKIPPSPSDVKGPLANEERMTLRMTVRHC